MSEAAGAADAEAISQLLSEAMPEHPTSPRRLRRGLFAREGFDPMLARLERDRNGRIESFVAVLVNRTEEGAEVGQLLVLATRADRRRAGLAGRLYAEVETELRRRGVAAIAVGGGLLGSGLDLRYRAATTMLMRRLYVTTSVAYDMTPDPVAPIPAEPEVEGFSIRDLVLREAQALDALCAAEFTGWRFAPELISSGEPCGVIGAFSPEGELAAFAGWNEHIFGPTGTAEQFRRRGLGAGVYGAALRAIRAAGVTREVVIGGANTMYYARAFGCHISGVIWRLRKDLTADAAISKGSRKERTG